jgi:pyridoxal phosphate enzyme (YggS family)
VPVIENISRVYRRISHAAMRGGRPPEDVRLVAVSKTVGEEAVREAYEAGQRLFGESRVQEAQKKAEALADLNISWHMVGHLQKNKAKAAVGIFDLIHSVDSVALLEAIARHAEAAGKVQALLLQAKLSEEEQKHGAGGEEVELMVRRAGALGSVKVEGLMTMPPFFDDPEDARPYFRRLREMNRMYGFPELSMGMTEDFEVAIEEGATLVRVGTAIFGERSYA